MNTNDFIAGYVGTDPVQRLYMGTELVWPLGPAPTPPPYEEQYMTVEALGAGTFHVNNENFFYSKNGGEWTTGTGHQSIQLAAGDKVRFKESTNYDQPGMFSGNTMSFNVYGNLNSMTYGDNFASQYDKGLRFIGYFRDSTGLVDASNLIMPEVTDFPPQALADSAYTAMFSGCTSLEYAPVLPVAFVPRDGYREMFKGCTSLKYIKCLATDITTARDTTTNWVSGITTDGVFVQASGVTWTQGVNIPETWMLIDAPQHDEGVWLRYYDVGLENPDFYEISGSTSGDTYVFGGSGLYSDMYLFYDGNYVFLNEVDICGYDTDGNDPHSEICGGEGGYDEDEGQYIECLIITGDTRYYSPQYQTDSIVYTPASGLLSIHTFAADCGAADCSDWENMGYSSYEECDCAENGNCPGVDCAANWNSLGYEYYEDCVCQENYGGDCPDCENDWESLGYESLEDCICQVYYNGCPDCENDWETLGYESEDDCYCQNFGVDTNGNSCE